MARNNRDRNQPGPKTKSAAPPMAATGGALSFATPTEFVELPTQGKYYPEGHALHNEKFVEIRYMTAKDEDILTSKSLLKRGIAIDRFLQNILVHKGIQLEDLYVGDKNALLIGARITGYGEKYECQVTCPSCGDTNDHDFNLGSVYRKEDLENPAEHGIDLIEDDTFVITTPVTKVDIKLRLLKSKDEKYLLKLSENKRKKKLPESGLTDQLRMIIVSVNDSDNGNDITALIQHLPARDSRYIRQAYQKMAPNIDLSQFFYLWYLWL